MEGVLQLDAPRQPPTCHVLELMKSHSTSYDKNILADDDLVEDVHQMLSVLYTGFWCRTEDCLTYLVSWWIGECVTFFITSFD